MKKGMSGRTKKRLSKQNRGTRKNGGNAGNIIASLIGLFIFIGFMGKHQFYREGKIEIEAVNNILLKYKENHKVLNGILTHHSLVSLPKKTKDALKNGLEVDKLLKKSMEASNQKEIQDALAGPVQSAFENAEEKDVNKLISWVESLKDKTSRVNGIVEALNNVHGSRSKSDPGKKRGNPVVAMYTAAEIGAIPKEYSLVHAMRGKTSGSRKSGRAKSWS